MHLFKQYLEERTPGKSLIYDDFGFATYIICNDEVYIEDLYVVPEFRKEKKASEYADKIAEIARSLKCKYMTGTVDTKAVGANDSTKILFAYGFKMHSAKDNVIYFIKDL